VVGEVVANLHYKESCTLLSKDDIKLMIEDSEDCQLKRTTVLHKNAKPPSAVSLKVYGILMLVNYLLYFCREKKLHLQSNFFTHF
jgi:hypothetical protein